MWYFWAKKLMEMWYLLISETFLFWTFRWWEVRSFIQSKSWWKDDIYRLLKSSCFELFGDGKDGLLFSQKVDGKMIFTDYWKVLVLNFSVMGSTVFYAVKKLMERWYLLVTLKFLFWTFRWWEIQPFFNQKVDGKMIFTWSFWAFHDIAGLGKHGFVHSDTTGPLPTLIFICTQNNWFKCAVVTSLSVHYSPKNPKF